MAMIAMTTSSSIRVKARRATPGFPEGASGRDFSRRVFTAVSGKGDGNTEGRAASIDASKTQGGFGRAGNPATRHDLRSGR